MSVMQHDRHPHYFNGRASYGPPPADPLHRPNIRSYSMPSGATNASAQASYDTTPRFSPVSWHGTIEVLGYTPHEAPRGRLTVDVSYGDSASRSVCFRIVVARKPIATAVRNIGAGGQPLWRLEGELPAFDALSSSVPTVDLSVQIVDSRDNKILDSAIFGDFRYILPSLNIETHPPTVGSSTTTRPSARTSSWPTIRRRDAEGNRPIPGGISQQPKLYFETPPEDMEFGLNDTERYLRRRLVRFQRVLDGTTLRVSCQPIRHDEYDDKFAVVSCIYIPETDRCCITSVDIISLMEFFVRDKFVEDEKNRIRRNIECLRPTTVSKTRESTELLWDLIMEFPRPKPRNIEKCIKVFDWAVLRDALEKVMSRYEIVTVPPQPETSPSTPQYERSYPSYSSVPPSESLSNPSLLRIAPESPMLTYPESSFPSDVGHRGGSYEMGPDTKSSSTLHTPYHSPYTPIHRTSYFPYQTPQY